MLLDCAAASTGIFVVRLLLEPNEKIWLSSARAVMCMLWMNSFQLHVLDKCFKCYNCCIAQPANKLTLKGDCELLNVEQSMYVHLLIEFYFISGLGFFFFFTFLSW